MSDPCWYDITEKDLVPPFTYYWVGPSPGHKIYKNVVTGLRRQGNDSWLTDVSEGLDFTLKVEDGKVMIPFSGSTDRIFNNWWVAYAHSLKLKAEDAAQ